MIDTLYTQYSAYVSHMKKIKWPPLPFDMWSLNGGFIEGKVVA